LLPPALDIAWWQTIFTSIHRRNPLPSTAKPRKSANSRSAASSNGNSAKKTSSSRARSISSRTKPASPRTRSASTKSRASDGGGISETVGAVGDKVGSIGSTVDSIAENARSGAGTIAKGAAVATMGAAVGAIAGRALIASRRRKRVLGVPMPRKHTNMKSIAKQLSGMAGELEKKSLDVSKASGRAKQAAKILS
jgi:cytoskeletal protein RodZ